MVSRDEALLILGKWRSEGYGVKCLGDFSGCSFELFGSITELSGAGLTLESFGSPARILSSMLEAPEKVNSKVPQNRKLIQICDFGLGRHGV